MKISTKNNPQRNLLFISLSHKETLQNSIHSYILNSLKNKFENIFVFCWGDKSQSKEDNIYYWSGNFLNWISYLKKISRIKYIYINDFFVGGTFGVFAKLKKKSKLILRCGSAWRYELNSFSSLIKTGILTLTKPFVIKNCNKVVYNSKSIVQKQYKHQWEVVYNGVDVNLFKPEMKRTKKDARQNAKQTSSGLNVLYIGRIRKEKGLDYLFRATKDMIDKINLGLIGEGPLRGNYRRKYPYARFYGKIKMTELPSIVNQYDVIILPSLHNSSESFPNVLLEAMACGKPVIGTNVQGIPEMITNGENGLLIPEKNPEAIRRAILMMLNQPNLRQKMGKTGRQITVKRFEKEKQIQKLYKALFSPLNQ